MVRIFGGPDWWTAGIRGLFSQTNGRPCSTSQTATTAALTGPQEFLKDWCATYQRRRHAALAGLAEIEGFATRTTGGALYLTPDRGALLGRITPDGKKLTSSTNLAAYFLEHGAVVVPVPGFSCNPFFRMSIATSEANIIEGTRRMKSAVELLN